MDFGVPTIPQICDWNSKNITMSFKKTYKTIGDIIHSKQKPINFRSLDGLKEYYELEDRFWVKRDYKDDGSFTESRWEDSEGYIHE